MHAEERARGGKLDEKVAVGNGVHGVLRDLRPAFRVDEAKRRGGELAVDGQSRASDGAGAQRTPVGVSRDVGQPRTIAIEHLKPGEQMMRKKHRLRPLQVRVAGDEHVAVRGGEGEQCSLGGEEFFPESGAGEFEPEPHVGRDLVVPAPRGVELGGGGHALRQRLLDIHVHVLELRLPREFTRLDFGEDCVEPGVDGVALVWRDQPDVREHGRVGLAASDVERCEAAIERDGLAELQHQLGWARSEAAAPRRLGRLGHIAES